MARARTILLVDPDPASAAALGPALRRRGFQVQVARDGSRALQLAVLRSPDLVLLDEGTPLVSAPTIARILRSNPRTSAIPILRTGRGEPVRPGEPFLRKPFDVDAVLAAIAGAVAERTEADRAAPDAGLEGSLEQLPLVDLVQMLSTNRRTGRLVVERPPSPDLEDSRAEVAFEAGRIVDATCEGAVGEKAFVRLLAARSGQFRFEPGATVAPARIGRRTDELLLDGLRQADETAALTRGLPPPAAELSLTGAAPRAAGPAVEEVRRLLATPARLRDLLDRAVGSDLSVLSAIRALLDAGEVGAARPAPPPLRSAAPELLDPAAAHALRTRILERGGASWERADREVVVTKALLAGADPLAARAALARLSGVRGFAEIDGDGGQASFGTAATVDLGALRLELVLLPAEPSLRPLWSVLVAGAACALVIAPAASMCEAVAALARSRGLQVGVCGAGAAAPDVETAASECGYLGPDPLVALRVLLARAAGRAASPSR